jgi:membrane protease YdiL (CAAX protease family)
MDPLEPPATTKAASPAEPAADDRIAAQLRGFGPLGLLAIALILLTGNIEVAPLVYVPAGALLVLAWVKLSRTPWREIGYVRPASWARTIAVGILFGAAFKVMMKMIVMPLLGADPVNHAYHFLSGNRALLPAAIYGMLNAGFSEETMYRGFFFERLRKLLGLGLVARIAILVVTSVGFGLAHYRVQGLAGTEQATLTGLVFGIVVMATGRIWTVMIAHAAFDLTALAMIYWDVEAKIGHALFK